MEDARGEGPHPESQEHVAKLADGRVRDHALDIVLDQADGGREDCGHASDDGHNVHRRVGQDEQGSAPGHHEHPCGDHGRRVDQRADRCRAFHGVRQPHVERELGGFSGGADKKQQADERDDAHFDTEQIDGLGRGGRGHRLEQIGEVQGPEGHEDEHHAQDEPEITYPVHHKGLDAGVGR